MGTVVTSPATPSTTGVVVSGVVLTSTAEPAGGAVAEPGLPPGYDAVAMRPPVAVRDGAVPSEKTGVVVSGTVAHVVVEPTKQDPGGSSAVRHGGAK